MRSDNYVELSFSRFVYEFLIQELKVCQVQVSEYLRQPSAFRNLNNLIKIKEIVIVH